MGRRRVRFVLQRSWSPVGSGVKTTADHVDLVSRMFKGDRLQQVMAHMDVRLGELPGLEGVQPGTMWAARIKRYLPAPAEEAALVAA